MCSSLFQTLAKVWNLLDNSDSKSIKQSSADFFGGDNMKQIIWMLWPAFIAAGVAEVVFFTVIDPQQLYLLGQPVELAAMATYSIGFLLFWVICSGSSLMTYFMLPQSVKKALENTATDRAVQSRPLPTGL